MNHDRLKYSTMDEADRQIQQALFSAPVPTSAKQRLREKLISERTLQQSVDKGAVLKNDAVQQDVVQQVSVPPVVGQTESRSVLITAASTQVEETRSTAKVQYVPRSRKQVMSIIACLAASILVVISLFYAAQPYSQNRLVAECTQRLEMQPDNSWDQATLSSWTESLNLLSVAGIVRGPKQILHQSIKKSVIGSQVRLWKLEFENQPSLYAVELLDAPRVQGVQQYLQVLNQANQSWSMATIRTDKSLFVFFTKGNLEQLMHVSPLA